jgi:hypothetical protein
MLAVSDCYSNCVSVFSRRRYSVCDHWRRQQRNKRLATFKSVNRMEFTFFVAAAGISFLFAIGILSSCIIIVSLIKEKARGIKKIDKRRSDRNLPEAPTISENIHSQKRFLLRKKSCYISRLRQQLSTKMSITLAFCLCSLDVQQTVCCHDMYFNYFVCVVYNYTRCSKPCVLGVQFGRTLKLHTENAH